MNGRGAKSVCTSALSPPTPPRADGVGSPDNFKMYPFLVISPLTCCQKEELYGINHTPSGEEHFLTLTGPPFGEEHFSTLVDDTHPSL